MTLQGKKLPFSRSATSAPFDFAKSRMATLPPFATNASAVASAMPDAPPTMIALLPEISIHPLCWFRRGARMIPYLFAALVRLYSHQQHHAGAFDERPQRCVSGTGGCARAM